MKSNKTILFIAKTIYNNGNLLRLIVDKSDIEKFELAYKNSVGRGIDFNSFENNNRDLFEVIKKSESAYREVKKQFLSNSALQPEILTECFIAQTIANKLGLNCIADADTKETVPVNIANILFQFYGERGSLFRYIYYDNNNEMILLQCGNSNTIDAVFVKSQHCARLEFKDGLSRIADRDITGKYGEDGKLILTEDFRSQCPFYEPIINVFNSTTNVFDEVGSNYNINDHINEDISQAIINSDARIKKIDLYIPLVNNLLFPVLPEYLAKLSDFKGSEIRFSGKNRSKVWTPKYLKSVILKQKGWISDTKASIPFTGNYRKARGTGINSGYKINEIFFVQEGKYLINNGNVIFELNDVQQLKPNISLHIEPVIDYGIIKEGYEEIIRLTNKGEA